MKKFIRFLSFFMLCALLSSFAVGCDNGNTDYTGDEVTTVSPDSPGALRLIIGGVAQFTIVRPDAQSAVCEKDAAVAVNTRFFELTGARAKITTDWERNGKVESEICVGELQNRDETYENIKAADLAENEFTVRAVGGKLVILGNSPYGTKKAADWFIENYMSEKTDDLVLPADFSYTGKYEPLTDIRIMTQNLLATDTEYEENMKNPSYAESCTISLADHTLVKRQPRFLSLIKTYKPDSIGIQECSNTWRDFLDAKLRNTEYRRVGATKNQKIGIIYNTSTLKLVAQNSIWLTEKPDILKISSEWGAPTDGLTERLCMYVVFEVVATGQRYIHFNTHLDTKKNAIIQTKQTEVILDYIQSVREKYGDIPVVLTGDFNYNSSSDSYKTLTSSLLSDTKKIAVSSSGGGSFNKFIGQSYTSAPIDQIMTTTDKVFVQNYKVLYDKIDDCFISDHYAVIADISYEK